MYQNSKPTQELGERETMLFCLKPLAPWCWAGCNIIILLSCDCKLKSDYKKNMKEERADLRETQKGSLLE